MSLVPQPAGTVTLVFTDIEGSTRLLDELGEAGYRNALAEHRNVVREAFSHHSGYEVDTQGDSFFYAFASATGAVGAVREAMAALDGGPIAIRVGIHTGEPALDPPNYIGLDVHAAARIMAAGHGGQVVLSQSTRDLLHDSYALSDLGEHRLKDLSGPRRLYQLGTDMFPPLKTLHRTNLPVPASAFIGRERELRELGALLHEGPRLLTLTGPGGVGKTRLALQSVADAADAFPDGVWWVPLASLRDPELVLPSVALALGVQEQPGRGLDETLVDVLSSGRAILLLDNVEQLLPGAVGPIATLRDAGGATLVVTSRERLRISGEQLFAVAPLKAAEAAELFSARTEALGAGAGDAESVAELCSRLDNLPLAVELAAARASLLAPADILSRLGGRLDRLRGDRDADPRQQTLRATIAWSHELLDQPEQELFARLAVFSGRVTLDAVEVVCDADLDVLTSLLDKSLVRRTGERIWMLETIREFASERLDSDRSANELRDRHSDYYVSFAEASDRALTGAAQTAALERLASERDDLRAAFEHLLEHDPPSALRLVAALWQFWFMRGHFHEGREMLRAALGRAGPEPTEARASALIGAGLLATEHGDYRESIDLLDAGLACARTANSSRIEVNALSLVATLGDRAAPEERIRIGEEAIAGARAYGDPWLLGLVIGNHGLVLSQLGEIEQATELTEEAYRVCRATGDVFLTAIWINNLAEAALQAEDTGEARTKLTESLELARLIGDTRGISNATLNLGWVELLEGDFDQAHACFEEAGAIARRLGRRAQVEAICAFAHLAAALGDADRSARLAGAVAALGGPAGFNPSASVTLSQHVEDARAVLGEHAWQKAWADGAALGFDAAFSLATDS